MPPIPTLFTEIANFLGITLIEARTLVGILVLGVPIGLLYGYIVVFWVRERNKMKLVVKEK